MHCLNIYRNTDANRPDTWVQIQESGWQAASQCLIGGGFNAVHPTWDPGSRETRHKGDEIAQWTEGHGLSLISTPGLITHQREGLNGSLSGLKPRQPSISLL